MTHLCVIATVISPTFKYFTVFTKMTNLTFLPIFMQGHGLPSASMSQDTDQHDFNKYQQCNFS